MDPDLELEPSAPMAAPGSDAELQAKPDAKQLSGDQAGPTVVGVRPAVDTISLVGFSPEALAAALLSADNGNSWEWQRIAGEIERRDPHYLSVLNTRKRVVSQVPITVEAASDSPEHKKHAEFVQDWLDRDVLNPALFDMLDAIGKGWVVVEIDWHCEAGNYWPQGFTWRPQRWFEPSWKDGETIWLRVDEGYQDLNAPKFVIHRHKSFSSLTIGSGLSRVAVWGWMFKTFTNRDWGRFVANYGAPMRVGKYGPEATPEDRDVLWDAVANIAGDCAAIMPKSMEVEFIAPANTAEAGDLFERRCNWIDSQISKVVLGQTATTDANPGSHAAGKTHRQVQEDIERADCALLASTLNAQVVRRMIAFSFGPQKAYPRLVIGRPDEAPLTEVIAALQWWGPQGLKIKASELRERLNFSEPDGTDDEDLVGGRVAPPAPLPAREGHPDGATDILAPEQLPPHTTGEKPEEQQVRPPGVSADNLHSSIGRIVALHAAQHGPRLIEIMTAQLAGQATPILDSLTDEIRAQLEAADDMDDLKRRLDELELSPERFAEAMQSWMTIAELAGQVSVLDSVGRGAV